MARPTLYNTRIPDAARFICRTWGPDRENLAKALGISLATLYDWEIGHPEFLEAVRQGSAEHDYEQVVDGSLMQLVRGYRVTRRTWDSRNQKFVDIDVDVPPDVRAIAVWLANREGWRTRGTPRQLGSGAGGDGGQGQQELIDDPRTQELAREIMETRHNTKIHVESEEVENDAGRIRGDTQTDGTGGSAETLAKDATGDGTIASHEG